MFKLGLLPICEVTPSYCFVRQNRLAASSPKAAITVYYYDGDKPTIELSTQGGANATNIYGLGIDENVVRFQPDFGYFFYQDHEGSVTHVQDQTGALVEQYRYDAFGTPTIRDAAKNILGNSAIHNRFMFTGREYQDTFGFYEYRARAYHPGIGRFMSEDPKGFDAGDYNLFRYVGNDPEDRTDPMGTEQYHQLLMSSLDRLWEMTKFFDRSNTFQGTFAQFLATQTPPADPGKLEVRSSRVVMTYQQIDRPDRSDDRGGYTPNPKDSSFVTSKKTDEDQLDLTYHLNVKSYINTARGPKTEQFSRRREPDHTRDFYDRRERFYAAARSLIGRRFDTRIEAVSALRAAVDPVVDAVYEYSKHWDSSGQHRPSENGRYLNPDE